MSVLNCHLALLHGPCSALPMGATKRTLPLISHTDERHADVHAPPGPLRTCAIRKQGRTIAPFVPPRPKRAGRPFPGVPPRPPPQPSPHPPRGDLNQNPEAYPAAQCTPGAVVPAPQWPSCL